MKSPPFLLAATLVFWGWQTGYLFVGTVMGIILESARLFKPRWEFSEEDFSRIWTFCSLLLLAGTVYAFTATDGASDLLSFLQDPNVFTQRRAGSASAQAVASLLRWQPMIFFPFVSAAAFSSREGIPLRTISLILQRRWRRARKHGEALPHSPSVDVGYPYFALCLFSASIQSNDDNWFFWGLCVLMAWGLWPLRGRRYRAVVWGGALVVALTLGYFGQRALGNLQQYLGTLNPQWFTQYARRGFDPRQAKTMIGQVGETKTSPRIVIRLEALDGSKPPSLLREASYRDYKGQIWFSGFARSEFETMSAETNGTSWVLFEDKSANAVARIACFLPGGQALLPLPRGSARLEELPAYILQKNNLGAVLAEGPGLVIFKVFFGAGGTLDAPPDEADVRNVPWREVPALQEVIEELQLRGKPLPDAMRALNAYFQTKFSYSIWQTERVSGPTNTTPLSRFLTTTRSGHCEYFATATVLLLRQLGFPARYAVGYAVHEQAGKNRLVVRQRDAHAWCLVWNGGRWQDFDTTPGAWVGIEGHRTSPFQSLADIWSRIGFELSRIRWGQSHLRQYFLWALLPVLLLLLIQILFRRRRRRQARKAEVRLSLTEWPGRDSELYELERRLGTVGLVRAPGESMEAFVRRVCEHRSWVESEETFQAALTLHNRYRFDPRGLSSTDREFLRSAAGSSLRHTAPPKPSLARFLQVKKTTDY